MEGPHEYEIVENPSYTRENTCADASSTYTAAKLTSVNKSNSVSAKETSNANKFTLVAVISLCFVIALAVSSIAIAVVTYFNMKALQSEDVQRTIPSIVTEMQAQITKLTRDLNATQFQLSEITTSINRNGSNVLVIPGKKDAPCRVLSTGGRLGGVDKHSLKLLPKHSSVPQ